jgi:hypothetical protein
MRKQVTIFLSSAVLTGLLALTTPALALWVQTYAGVACTGTLGAGAYQGNFTRAECPVTNVYPGMQVDNISEAFIEFFPSATTTMTFYACNLRFDYGGGSCGYTTGTYQANKWAEAFPALPSTAGGGGVTDFFYIQMGNNGQSTFEIASYGALGN